MERYDYRPLQDAFIVLVPVILLLIGVLWASCGELTSDISTMMANRFIAPL